ncbi:hypothetical protein BSKO_03669 [Bryopsis sp. KO-2023]|nr:hypothetical protein BSKO_03669 [Bryopsis sp. KO-2023]
MANYYHEARAHARRLKELSEENKRRAERRAELASAQAEHPINFLMIEGHACKLHRNAEQYQQIERQEGMIHWNGQEDNLIDRFDGRALLDFYREPTAATLQRKPEDGELDQLVCFESYRDLIRVKSLGVSEREGLRIAERENIEVRAAAKVAAAQAVAGQQIHETPGLSSASIISSGLAAYAATGFSLDGSSSESDPDDVMEGERDLEAGCTTSDGKLVLDRDVLDKLGEEDFAVEDFSHKLKKAMKLEGEAEALRFKATNQRRISRKKYAERAKRMAGQGLDAFGRERDWRDPYGPLPKDGHGRLHDPRAGSRRASPDYQGRSRRRSNSRSRSKSRSRSASRSRSPSRSRSEGRSRAHGRSNRPEFITEFRADHGDSLKRGHGWVDESAADRRAEPSQRTSRGDGVIFEALPTKDGIGPLVYPDIITDLRALDPSRMAMERKREEKKEAKEKERRDRYHAEAKSKKTASDLLVESRDARMRARGAEKKETPQERIKRIMAAQLNKQVKKDSLASTQKRIEAERDRQARLQIERVAFLSDRQRSVSPRSRSPSPVRRRRSRSRSYSPRKRKHRSRSRSRSKSWSKEHGRSKGRSKRSREEGKAS